MSRHAELQMIGHRYREAFGANLSPSFDAHISCRNEQESTAALGYARAGIDPLFLEAYLDQPIETMVSAAFSHAVARSQIIEIGNFAAISPQAMILLWGAAANDLSAIGEIAVATLTRPLRQMFRRIGVPIVEIAEARRERLGQSGADWGAYFDQDPRVCTGVIADGQHAINAFLDRRFRREVA